MKDDCVAWFRETFEKTKGDYAIIGISGGKDSSIAAALCVAALGKEKVIGVLMPNGNQSDIEDSYQLVNFLGIEYVEVNIHDIHQDFLAAFPYELAENVIRNFCPRIRMSMLYAIAQKMNGRVINTSNADEFYLGYYTRWGDEAGDIAPLRGLLVREVIQLGEELGLPSNLIYKTPSDGLAANHNDEDDFGFTYNEVDDFLEKASQGNWEINSTNSRKIYDRHCQNSYKKSVPIFNPKGRYLV